MANKVGVVGEWLSEFDGDWQVLYLAKNFNVSPLEVENEWDYRRYRIALDFLFQQNDIETAKLGWEMKEYEKNSKK